VISELAEHTRNLRADSRCSLLVAEAGDDDPLAIGRVTLIGTAAVVADDEQAAAKAHVVERLPTVGGYAAFGDFSCWRLEVAAVRWVGGFGRMDWVDAAAYASASVDPVLASRRGVIEHMNTDHADAGVELCQRALGDASAGTTVTAATFDLVDRFGCDYVAATSEGTAYVRLGFDAPATTVDEVRAAIIALLRAARTK
jgi:putative heme iron utilization protein